MAKDASKDGDVPYATRWFENGVQKEVIGAVDEAAMKRARGWSASIRTRSSDGDEGCLAAVICAGLAMAPKVAD